MEKSNRVSAFDILNRRMMMPDVWIFAEPPAASKREITRRKINRIFRGVLERFGWSSLRRSEVFTRANELK
jgi:ABC-type arginine transport system ATPase subunit